MKAILIVDSSRDTTRICTILPIFYFVPLRQETRTIMELYKRLHSSDPQGNSHAKDANHSWLYGSPLLFVASFVEPCCIIFVAAGLLKDLSGCLRHPLNEMYTLIWRCLFF